MAPKKDKAPPMPEPEEEEVEEPEEPEPEPEEVDEEPPSDECCMWRHVKRSALRNIAEKDTPAEQLAAMAEIEGLMVSEYCDSDRQSIYLDLYYLAYRFSTVECQFSIEKTSTFLSIMVEIVGQATGELQDRDTSFAGFRQLMINHATRNTTDKNGEPWLVKVFTVEDVKDVKLITEYVTRCFYRQYSLYSFVATFEQHIDLSEETQFVEKAYPGTDLKTANMILDDEEEQEQPAVEAASVEEVEADAEAAAGDAEAEADDDEELDPELAEKLAKAKARMERTIGASEAKMLARIEELEKQVAAGGH